MRFLLPLFLFLCTTTLSAQVNDTLYPNWLWEETTVGPRLGFRMRFNDYGSFEEDAGENSSRAARYLMGQWNYDREAGTLTLAVDYHLGQRMVHRRYRKGQDFYLVYTVEKLTSEVLEIKDVLTGETRTFAARPLNGVLDAGERRARKLGGRKNKGGLEIPEGW